MSLILAACCITVEGEAAENQLFVQ
jgi:hypothetical protein